MVAEEEEEVVAAHKNTIPIISVQDYLELKNEQPLKSTRVDWVYGDFMM